MSDNSNTNPPSTIGAYVDQAIGAAQSALGSLTGNTTDQVSIHPSIQPNSSQPH